MNWKIQLGIFVGVIVIAAAIGNFMGFWALLMLIALLGGFALAGSIARRQPHWFGIPSDLTRFRQLATEFDITDPDIYEEVRTQLLDYRRALRQIQRTAGWINKRDEREGDVGTLATREHAKAALSTPETALESFLKELLQEYFASYRINLNHVTERDRARQTVEAERAITSGAMQSDRASRTSQVASLEADGENLDKMSRMVTAARAKAEPATADATKLSETETKLAETQKELADERKARADDGKALSERVVTLAEKIVSRPTGDNNRPPRPPRPQQPPQPTA